MQYMTQGGVDAVRPVIGRNTDRILNQLLVVHLGAKNKRESGSSQNLSTPPPYYTGSIWIYLDLARPSLPPPPTIHTHLLVAAMTTTCPLAVMPSISASSVETMEA